MVRLPFNLSPAKRYHIAADLHLHHILCLAHDGARTNACTRVCQCEGVLVWGCQCEGVSVWGSVNVRVCQCEGVSGWGCVRVRVCQGEGVSVWGCVSVRVCQGEGVSGWGCVRVRACQCEGVWGCAPLCAWVGACDGILSHVLYVCVWTSASILTFLRFFFSFVFCLSLFLFL